MLESGPGKTGAKQTKRSFSWISQHWLGVIVIAGVAASSGWALGQNHRQTVVETELRTSSDHEAPANSEHFIAFSPERLGVVKCWKDIESEKQAEASNEAPARINPENLATAFVRGSDSESHAALMTALQYNIELSSNLLVDAYVNDASDDVRLLAFTTYIDSISDDVEAVRTALQSATNNTSPIVQAEAYQRLKELASYEAAMVASPAQGLP